MDAINIESLGQRAIFLLSFSVFIVVILFSSLIWLAWYLGKKRVSMSPYSKKPMTYGVDLAVSIAKQIEQYLSSLPQPENTPFDITKAAICLETNRIFPDCVNRGELIRLDWEFLVKRHRGRYVSWGSLTEVQKATIRLCHSTLEGFQTEVSSSKPLPQDIEPYYALARPGPLYVDIATRTLLGWKRAPGTDFEVLVVQLPDFESIDDTL
jgi:hypothetical protein